VSNGDIVRAASSARQWREEEGGRDAEGEAEDGEVDLLLLRRVGVGVGGADTGASRDGAEAGLASQRRGRAVAVGSGWERSGGARARRGMARRTGCSRCVAAGVKGSTLFLLPWAACVATGWQLQPIHVKYRP
jgi:hypothetical protein